ncbi:MAG: PAS domain S-box protein, partial [Deltaproteobacteria bacterium]
VTAKKLDLSDIETSPQLIDAYTRNFSFAVKNGNQALLERLNQGLNIIKSTGQYDDIYKKWFGALEDPHLHRNTAIKYGSMALLVLFGFIVWNIILKRQVKSKTAHLLIEIAERKRAEEALLALSDRLQEQNEELQMNEEELRSQNDELLSAEVMLRIQKECAQSYLDTVETIIVALDDDGKISTINRKACQILGYEEDELLGQYWFKTCLPQPEGMEVVYPYFLGIISGKLEGSEYPENAIVTKSGELRQIAWHNAMLRDEQGKIYGTLSAGEDITLRKQTEYALKDAEWKFQALFNNGPIGVAYHSMIYDESGEPVDYHFIDANDNFINLTGVDPRGKTVTQAFPGIEKDPFDWIGTFGRVAKTGEAIHFEQYLQSNNRWYDVVGYQYKPDHFVASFIEITQRKQAEEQLNVLSQRLQLATSSARLAVWDWNVRDNQMNWDDRMFELYGIVPDTFSSNIDAWMNGLHPDDKDAAVAECQAAMSGEKEFNTVFRVLHPDGTVKHLKANAIVIRGTD